MEFSLFFVLFIAYFTSYINAEVETPVALPIIGGNLAHKNQFKYQVSLQRNGAHTCGGGIIADYFVLTAAHCVLNIGNEKFCEERITVVAGVLDANHEKGVEAEVTAIYVPKTYNRRTNTGDIAVLKLKNVLGLNKNEYLRLPMKIKWNYPSYANNRAIVTGYGWNKATVKLNDDGMRVINGSSDWKLRFGESVIIDNKQCAILYLHLNYIITSDIICAKMDWSRYDVGHNPCKGDSGGPLVVHRNIVVGVTSSNIRCNERLFPGKYTRVSSFVPFINNVLKGNRTSGMRVATWKEPWWTRWIPFVDAKFVEN